MITLMLECEMMDFFAGICDKMYIIHRILSLWPQVVGEYPGSASSEGYQMEDGTPLNLSEKDTKWLGIRETFKF